MSRIIRATATRDIRSIDAALRAYHPRSAAKFAAALARLLGRLERLPLSGAEYGPAPGGFPIVRIAGVSQPNYVVLHLPLPDGVEIARVVDGRRDLDAIVAGITP